MAKKQVSEALIHEISRLKFGFAEKMMDRFGSFDLNLSVIEVSATRVLSVNSVKLPPGVDAGKAYIAKKLPGLIAKNSVVVVMCEAWVTNESGVREEAVTAMIYVNGTSYLCRFDIKRNPLRLEYKEPINIDEARGAMSPGGSTPYTAQECEKSAAEMRKIILRDDERWEVGFSVLLKEYINRSQDISPVTRVLYDINLPAEKAEAAMRVMNYNLTVHEIDSQGEDIPNRLWLAGMVVHIGNPVDSTEAIDVSKLPSDEELIAIYCKHIRELMPPYVPFYPAPQGKFFSREPYLPVSILHVMSCEAEAWSHDAMATSHCLDYIQEKNQKVAKRGARIPGVDSGLRVVFATAYDRCENIRNLMLPQHKDDWLVQEEIITKILEEAAEKTTAESGVSFKHISVEPVFESMATFDQYEIAYRIHFALDVENIEPEKEQGIFAELTMASFKEPLEHEETHIVLNDKDGKFLTAISFPRKPDHLFPDFFDELKDSLDELGIKDVRYYPEILRGDWKTPGSMDVFAPDFQGGWFCVTDIKIPQAKGMLRKAGWEYVDEEILSNPDVSNLPFPHRLSRAGLIEVIQRHYSPHIYRLLKLVCSDLSVPTDKLWTRLIELEPRFKAFMDAMPNWACPDVLATRSTRVVWGKAPTLITTNGLSERLALTDIDLFKVPARFLHTPYPISYLHFQSATNICAVVNDGDAGDDFQLEGAFLENFETDMGRRFQIVPIWRAVQDPNRNQYSEVTVTVMDDMESIGDLLTTHFQEKALSKEEIEGEMEAISEIVKVLVYLNLKDARLVQKAQRTEMMRGVEKKSFEQRMKITARATGLCDHILVGPESLMGDINSPGVSGRTKAIHTRRGHMHIYRTGKGRVEVTLKFIEPILVNKHLLQEGDDAPAPKNYRLQ